MSAAGNWGGTAPNNGDDLVFPAGATSFNPQNDLSGLSVQSITFTGSGYTLTGNAITVTAGGTIAAQLPAISDWSVISLPLIVPGATTISLAGSTNATTLNLQGNIQGGGSLTLTGCSDQCTIGMAGDNTYSGGTTVATNRLFIMVQSDTALGTGPVTIPFAVSSTINLGGHTLNNAGFLGGYGISGNGILNDSGTWSGNITLTEIAGIGTGGDITISGKISGNYGLTAPTAGSGGTVRLTADNDYTDTTRVRGSGTLFVMGSQPSSALIIDSASTLAGTGRVGRVNTNFGRLSPGMSPGIITTGDLFVASESSLAIEINGAAPGSQYDQVNVVGTVTLSGDLSVTLAYSPTPGSQFTIINNDGADPVSGTFSGLPEGTIFDVGGQSLQISYIGGDGNDVVLTVPGGAQNTGVTSVPTLDQTALLMLSMLLILSGASALQRR